MRMTSSQARRVRRDPRRQTGFTMAETLVVLVLLAIVGGSLMNVMGKQQAFYQGTGDLIALRTQLRQGEAILSNDLRGISSVGSALGSDILTMTDSSIDFRYTIGTSVVCSASPGSRTSIVIPGTGAMTNGNTMTSWLSKPTFGDTAYIFDEGASTTLSTDDSWQAYKVTALALGSGSCDGSFNASSSATLTLASTSDQYIVEGAPIRFMRQAHYSLYQAADSLWYLGYCSPACSVTNAITPVAGPFQPYVASTTNDASGIRITYYDSTNAVTSTAANVARINITLRGQTTSYLHIQGMTRGVYHDSLSMSIALRNRS